MQWSAGLNHHSGILVLLKGFAFASWIGIPSQRLQVRHGAGCRAGFRQLSDERESMS